MKIFFEKKGCIFLGEIEKELENTYILVVKTTNKKFNELYHGRIAVSKKKCYSDKTKFNEYNSSKDLGLF